MMRLRQGRDPHSVGNELPRVPPQISVVLPAYNEAERLPPYLASIRDYLGTRFSGDHEVIVVDDGSDDGLDLHLIGLCADWPEFRLLRHGTNQGKGAAVRTGMLSATGELLLFADADGATPICEESRLRNAIVAGADIACGSRFVERDTIERNRTRWRGWGGRCFSRFVHCVCHIPIHDTQCGFKMFRRAAGWQLFGTCPEDGYLFDIHILALAASLELRVAEVGVHWQEQLGSKIRPVRDSCKMAWGLWRVAREVRRTMKRAGSDVRASGRAEAQNINGTIPGGNPPRGASFEEVSLARSGGSPLGQTPNP